MDFIATLVVTMPTVITSIMHFATVKGMDFIAKFLEE